MMKKMITLPERMQTGCFKCNGEVKNGCMLLKYTHSVLAILSGQRAARSMVCIIPSNKMNLAVPLASSHSPPPPPPPSPFQESILNNRISSTQTSQRAAIDPRPTSQPRSIDLARKRSIACPALLTHLVTRPLRRPGRRRRRRALSAPPALSIGLITLKLPSAALLSATCTWEAASRASKSGKRRVSRRRALPFTQLSPSRENRVAMSSGGAVGLRGGCDGLLRRRLPQCRLVDRVGADALACLMTVPVSSHPSSADGHGLLHLAFAASGFELELRPPSEWG